MLCYCRCINTIYVVICITDQEAVKTCVENALDLSYSVDMLDGTNSHRNGLFKIKCFVLNCYKILFFKEPGTFIIRVLEA